jgi:G:T-mismatch repair DNA endonuclease (very short patch repair protein)
MRKCPYCLNVLNTGSKHIYFCSDDRTKTKKQIKYEYISFNFNELSNENKLRELYQNNLMSLPDIKSIYGIDYKSTLFLLDYFNIEKRTSSSSAKKISVPKQRETLMLKYGVDWSSKLDYVKEKKKRQNLGKYGVDNIWKSDWFKSNRDEFYIEKYGMPLSEYYKCKWDSKSDDEKRSHMLNSTLKSSQNSSIETRIKEVLDIIGIEYTSQFSLRVSGKIRFYDIKIGNIIIEINGDFWHGNPLLYKKCDILKFPGKEVLCESLWLKDEKKKEIAIKNGYSVVYLWESYIRNSSNDELVETLNEILVNGKLEDRNYDKNSKNN